MAAALDVRALGRAAARHTPQGVPSGYPPRGTANLCIPRPGAAAGSVGATRGAPPRREPIPPPSAESWPGALFGVAPGLSIPLYPDALGLVVATAVSHEAAGIRLLWDEHSF
jgi:hypothetical protein